MTRRALYVLAPAAVAAVVGLYHVVRLVAGLPPGYPYPPLYTLYVALVPLLLGRCLLALLPPGHVGAHRVRDLPETWAASHLLGRVVLSALSSTGVAGLAVLALAVVARLFTLPGAMVPRHRLALPAPDRATPFARALLGAAALLPLVLAHVRPHAATYQWSMYHGVGWRTVTALAALDWLALAVLLERGLARVGRASTARALFLGLGLAALLAPVGLEPRAAHVALGVGAAAVFLRDWRLRADRRALWLAGLALVETREAGWTLLLLGLAALVLLGPPHRRGSAIVVALASGLAAFLLEVHLTGWIVDWGFIDDPLYTVPAFDPTPLHVVTCLAPAALLLVGLALPRVSAGSPASRS